MTTEQRIERLDKRIQIFDFYLNAQQSVLNYKYGKDRSLGTLFKTMAIIESDAIQSQIIARQPIAKSEHKHFAKGGFISSNRDMVYVTLDGILCELKK